MKKLFILIILLFSGCDSVSLDNKYSEIIFYNDPSVIIEMLGKKAELTEQEHFILANEYKEQKDLKKALHHYLNSAFRYKRTGKIKLYPDPIYKYLKTRLALKSPFYDTVCFEVSNIITGYNEKDFSNKIIELLETDNLPIYIEAQKLKAANLTDLEKYDEALVCLNNILTLTNGTGTRSVVLIKIGSIYEKVNDIGKANEHYFMVLKLFTDKWQSFTAAERILSINKDTIPSLSNEDILLLSEAMYSSKKYDIAYEILSAKNNYNNINYTTLVIKTLIRLNKTQNADELIESHKSNLKDYYLLNGIKADVFWYSGRRGQAVEIYKNLAKNSPDAIQKDQLERLLNFTSERNISETITYLNVLVNKFGYTTNTDNYLWNTAKYFLENEQFDNAETYLKIISDNLPKENFTGNANFWLYKINKKKNNPDAEKYLKRLIVNNFDSDYAWILADSLKDDFKKLDLSGNFNNAVHSSDSENALYYHTLLFLTDKKYENRDIRLKILEEKGLNPYSKINYFLKEKEKKDNDYNNLELYFSCGYEDGIKKYFSYLEDENQKTAVYYYMSLFGSRYRNFYHQFLGTFRLFSEFEITENIALLESDYSKRLLPLAYWDIVKKVSLTYNVEIWKIYAIMKAESVYNHRAVSSVGAAGLMQLMPATAKDIAKGLKITSYNLYDPEISITFGTNYLNWLRRIHKDNFRIIAGSYNAGPGNMIKWQENIKADDFDLFVEKVPFEETRGYMLRITKFLFQYRILYNEQ